MSIFAVLVALVSLTGVILVADPTSVWFPYGMIVWFGLLVTLVVMVEGVTREKYTADWDDAETQLEGRSTPVQIAIVLKTYLVIAAKKHLKRHFWRMAWGLLLKR